MTDTLKGQFLIAMPGMQDDRFTDSVIYLIGHGVDGAMGLVVNQPLTGTLFSDVFNELGLGPEDDRIDLPAKVLDVEVLRGGPVDTGRGFVLHTPDYFSEGSSFCVNDEICLTATHDVLRAIVWEGEPAQSLFVLGYCGWSPGQLESEIKANGWLTAPHSRDLLFSVPAKARYERALAGLGINRASLSADAGHA